VLNSLDIIDIETGLKLFLLIKCSVFPSMKLEIDAVNNSETAG
jgi:hypothetical protein